VLLVQIKEVACQLANPLALTREVLEEHTLGVLYVRGDIGHLVGPLRKHFLCCLVEEANLVVLITFTATIRVGLELIRSFLERPKGVPDVLSCLGRDA